MACQLKEKKIQTYSHVAHTRTAQKNKNPVFSTTLNLQQTQIQNYVTMLPFLIQKMPILGVYIYIFIFQWFTVDLFLNILCYYMHCFLYLTAFPFIYLHVSSFHLPQVFGWCSRQVPYSL